MVSYINISDAQMEMKQNALMRCVDDSCYVINKEMTQCVLKLWPLEDFKDTESMICKRIQDASVLILCSVK